MALRLWKTEPVWVEHPDYPGVRFHLAPILPGDTEARVTAYTRFERDSETGEVRGTLDLRLATEDDFTRRHVAPFVRGWEGVQEADGSPLVPSPAALLRLLRQHPGLTGWIIRECEALGARLREAEDAGKAPS